MRQSSQDWRKELEVLKDETEVKCRQLFNKEYVLCGTFNQISTAETLLQGILQQRSSVLQKSKRGNDAIHQLDTRQTQQNSSEVWDTDNLNTSGVSSFEVQPQFMKFLQQVYKKKLQEIEETHGVKIVWMENASQVQIHCSEILNHPHSYLKGCDTFIDLYQKLYPNMVREVVDIKSADSRALLIEAIKSVEREYQVVIEIKGNKLLILAGKNNIISSVQALKETLESLQGVSRKTNTNLGVREHENVQEDRFSVLKQLLSHGVMLFLYQSDITDERVDAIVNAANDGLQHGGGVAAAIVRKGGRQIDEESRQIMFNRNYRPLNVGDAVYTRGGNLSCPFVIHTVGPRWNSNEEKRCTSLLRRACVESLRLAARLNLCSIALPAISSGIFGMPKTICARAMFQAMEEFSSSTDAEISTLRDVRIVIIDDETIDVFREVFVKRYISPGTPSIASPDRESHPPPFNENQGSSSALNAVANHPTFSAADNLSDPPPRNCRKNNNDVALRNKRVDPNAENNEPRNEEQESSSALSVVPKHSDVSLADTWSDKPPEKSREDNNDVESSSKGVDPNAQNNEPNKKQESSSALNVVANHPASLSADNRSDKLPKKTGEDINDFDSLSKLVDPNAQNNEPPNEEQESSSALNVVAKHPAFLSGDNWSDKPPKKTGEDNNDVESLRKGVDPNAENNGPPNEEQESLALNVVPNDPAFVSADNRSDKRPIKTGKDINDYDSLSKRVDPNTEDNEPPNEEQESSPALNVVANDPAFASADSRSDKPPMKTGKDINDFDSLSKGVDPNEQNNEPHNEEQESSPALNFLANHPAFVSADNRSDKPPIKTGKDINDFDSLSKGVDPNAQNSEPPNEEQESSSALNIVANHPAFVSADNRSDKPPKKTGEDINDVDSLNKAVDRNAENNEPPDEDQESSSALNVVADHPAFLSAANRSDTPPKKTREDTTDVKSLSKRVNLNAENNDPPSEKEEYSALNVVANHPGFSSADNWSNTSSRKTGKDNNDVEAPSKRVDPNAQNNEHRKQMPDSIKDGQPSPASDVETSNVDTEVNAFVKGPELSNMSAAVKPLRGSRKGIAATFSGRSQGETGSKSSGSTQLPSKTCDTKSVSIGRGRGMTYAATNSPPGLTVTEEGQNLAREHANRVKDDQNTGPAEWMKEKEESEGNESNNEAMEDENQELREMYQQIDEDKLNNVFSRKLRLFDGITNQEETRPSDDGIVNPKKAEETTKNKVEVRLTDDKRSLSTDENVNNPTGPIQPDRKPKEDVQVDQSSSSAVNNGASYPEEQLPPNHLEMSPAAEAIAPTASYGSVTVQDTGEERQATRSDAGKTKYFFIILSVYWYCQNILNNIRSTRKSFIGYSSLVGYLFLQTNEGVSF